MNFTDREALAARPACVLLDLDNTLYDAAPGMAAGMEAARAFAADELAIAPEDFGRAYQVSREELKRRLGSTASSHSRLLYFQRAIERVGLATQPFAALQMEQAYWSAYLGASVLFDGAREFIDDLRIAGIPCVIVTDLTAQIQHRKLIFFGLHKLIDWMVTSEEVPRDKPEPEIFELALAKLGGIEGPVWMIGDSAERDVAGARRALAAGTIQKVHPGIEIGQGDLAADGSFRHFSELRKHLKSVL